MYAMYDMRSEENPKPTGSRTSPILRDWSISGALRGVSIQIDICIVVITNKIDFWFSVFFLREKAYIRPAGEKFLIFFPKFLSD